MAENKTKPTRVSIEKFLETVSEKRREEAREILKIMKRVTKMEPVMWGPSIIGFGSYHYKYDSGHEGDACIAGFSPRKQSLTIYITPPFRRYEDKLAKLGKHRTSVSCLYINKLADVDIKVLEGIISDSFNYMMKKYSK